MCIHENKCLTDLDINCLWNYTIKKSIARKSAALSKRALSMGEVGRTSRTQLKIILYSYIVYMFEIYGGDNLASFFLQII